MASIPGSERSPRERNGNPLQHFAWEIPWTEKSWAIAHGVTKSQTWLVAKQNYTYFYFIYIYVCVGVCVCVCVYTTATAKSHQSCPILCDPTDSSPPGSTIPGILQARILEWVATSCSNAWKWKVKVKSFGHVQLLATPWTVAYQAPLSMEFPRQEYWSGLPLPLHIYI